MKLIIDIPESAYKQIKDYEKNKSPMEYLERLVAKGTPLEKEYDISQMMYEIYMEGVNMAGEYQGCWVRFKDIEKIVDKYVKGER